MNHQPRDIVVSPGHSWCHIQRSAKKFFCFAKHDPGSARQKYTQPGKKNLADLCNHK